MPIDIIRYIEDMILSGKIAPEKMVIICHTSGSPLHIFNANLNSMEAIGLLEAGKSLLIQDGTTPMEDDDDEE